MGEARYARLLAEHRRLVRDSLAAHGGQEMDAQGDGFFAVFTSPKACSGAVLEMQRQFAARDWPEGEQVRVRMGVHSGEASETATGLVGLDVHRAARLAGVAHGGQVVFSSAAAALVRDSLPDGVSLRDLGLHRLKDLRRPEQLYQLQAAGLQREFPPLRSLDNPALPNNLPVQPASFVGRERELSDLRRLVRDARLVTLTGAGGAGKTRLGIQLAAELLDGSGEGVWLVELAGVSDEDAVAPTILDVLGMVRRSDQSPLDFLVERLVSQRVLIVLDNCEHLIGACAKVADAILRRCRQVYLLTTSREPLGITGETIYRVPSMSLPPEGDDDGEMGADGSDAVALFADRAAAQGAGFVLDRASAPLVAQICRRLDGMPLAIELAASRLGALSLADLNDRLDQRFRLLTGGSRNALPRQQTLLATVDWSYSLLTAPEQKLLRRLSVFIDGFQLDAAEAVCAGGDLDVYAVTDLLASLVNKSLVVTELTDGALRYRLLETIRQFAAERLIESGPEADELTQAHCLYFLSVAEAARVEFAGPAQVRWIRRLNAEQGNLWRAIEYAAGFSDAAEGTEQVLRFVTALARYWIENVSRERALGLLVPVLERPEAGADPALRCTALASTAMIARGIDMELALQLGEEAMGIADQLEEDRLVIDAAMTLCSALYFAGMSSRGLAYGETAVERARRSGDDGRLGPALVFLLLCVDRMQPDRTEALTAEAIACVERTGDQSLSVTLYNNAGVYRLRKGDLPSARRFLKRAEEANRALGLHNSTPMINLGWVLGQEGDTVGSAEAFRGALRESHRGGDRPDIAYSTLGLACHASDIGAWDRSALLHGIADGLLGSIGEPWQVPEDSYRQLSLDKVRAHLGEAEFEASYGRGMTLDLTSAIDVTLDRV